MQNVRNIGWEGIRLSKPHTPGGQRGLSMALIVSLLTACTPLNAVPTAVSTAVELDLSGIKTYLGEKSTALMTATTALQTASDAYYVLAQGAGFDYVALWEGQPEAVKGALTQAREAWVTASPTYEQMEGIVAGVPALADFDVILDAGASGAEDPENAVPFDLTLPDGRVLVKPGNLFGVTESTLWGTEPDYDSGVAADWDGDGQIAFGESLPDANVLKAGVDALHDYAQQLQTAAAAWTPNEAEALQALVTMVPTMSEYFNSWKTSRFVAGEASEQRDFVAISRLADIGNILGGLEVVYADLRPLTDSIDAAQSQQIADDLAGLRAFVADVYAREQAGERFTAEEADTLGAEAQNRAMAITGQIAQLAARLGIQLEE